MLLSRVLSLPRVLLFPIAEKVDKKATAAPCSVKGTSKANLCIPNRPRPILGERRGFAQAGDDREQITRFCECYRVFYVANVVQLGVAN